MQSDKFHPLFFRADFAAPQQFGSSAVALAVLPEGELPLDALPVVLPEALPPVEPLAPGGLEGGLEGELEGEAEEAEPALDGLDALFSRGWPFESLQCVEAEMLLLLLAPAAGDGVDCAEAETAPKHSSVVASRMDFIFMGALLGIAPPCWTLTDTQRAFQLNI